MSPSASGEGLALMRRLAAALPSQLEEGYRRAREMNFPVPRRVRHAFAYGMGGSAIAADLVSSLTAAEADLTLTVRRGPELPRSFDRDALGIFVSYSGDTWETIAAYAAAGRRGIPRIALSSGGQLAEDAEHDGVPHLVIPPGMPPRAAVGFLFGGLLGILDPFFDTSNESRVESARKSLEQLLPRWSARSGPAALVARSLRGRMPYICVDEGLEPLARRWKTQLDENAKQLAQFDTVPELFHNSLVGWDALSASEARKRAAVLLEWELQPESTAARFRYLTRLLKKRGVALSNVWLRGEDRLLAIVEGVAFGDQVSLFLAEAKRVDPYPVDAITRMKAALSRPG